jgi:hypothetical protein
MTTAQRTTLRWFLLALSVCIATAALYLFSIMRAGQGRYTDLAGPVVGFAVLSSGTAVAAGNFWAAVQNRRNKLRAMILCLAGSGLVAASVFYGVLANCHLSQTVTVIEKKPSPDGTLVAVHLRKRCEALVGYCPSVTQVRIVRTGEDPTGSGTSVLQFREETDYVKFDWTSNSSVRITYPGGLPVLYRA